MKGTTFQVRVQSPPGQRCCIFQWWLNVQVGVAHLLIKDETCVAAFVLVVTRLSIPHGHEGDTHPGYSLFQDSASPNRRLRLTDRRSGNVVSWRHRRDKPSNNQPPSMWFFPVLHCSVLSFTGVG